MDDPPPAPPRRRAARSAPASTPEAPRRIKVSELLGEGREAILEHDGQEYRLRITASRKLILMK
jgi:hemin uptake protein HemP